MTSRVVALLLLLTTVARADWEVKRSPFDAKLVARYKQLLHQDPDDHFALGKLLSLYQQYRTVDELKRELSATAAQSHAADDYVALGHLLRERGELAAAAQQYEAALKAEPSSARAAIALGDAWVKLGRARDARALYEQALPRLGDVKRKRPLLRKLADLALAPDRGLAARDAIAEARRYFDELLRLDPRDDDTRRELAEALAAHGAPREAATEWRTIAGNLTRDPARQGQAWQRSGELDEATGDDAGALDAYRKAYAIAPRGHYLRREAADRIAGVYRKKDELRKLIGEWEQKWPERERDFIEWELLARLYDEIGDAARAESAFVRALQLDPHALEARKRLIALYERVGKDAAAVAEYRRLIAAAPGEPRFRLELAERLMKSNDGRAEALRLAAALGRESSDPTVHGQLAELYTRWGLTELALKEQELLVKVEPDDEGHLVALGELYFQRGNKKHALEIWRRLLDARGLKKELAMARLAEVYAEHDLLGEALELYEKAAKLAPEDTTVARGLATALERLHRDREAEEVWQQLFDAAATAHQRPAQLEARQRLLTLLQRQGRLGLRAAEYRARADRAKDEAVAAAYTLLAADALLKMGRAEMAAELLRALADDKKTPSVQADGWIGLAQVYKSRRRLKDAVAALKRAAELAPERARELYPQMAELSLQLYQDQDALSYARRAIELGPSDAQAQVRLGEVLEKSDDIAGAALAYERALELNDRLWRVYFTLARLRIRRGEHAQAAQLYRQIIRRSPEEELVIDAARRAIDLEEYLGSLGELERELEPLAYAHADKPVYRNLLLELYDRYGTPLTLRAHDGDASVRPKLELLGEHSVRPLLDVLVDGDAQQQRTAVSLLGDLGNRSAATPLLKLAMTPSRHARAEAGGREPPPINLRVDAAIAAARLAGPHELLPLAKLASDGEKQLRIAALFGLGRVADAKAEPLLQHALDDGAVEAQALACMGLAHHPHGLPTVLATLRDAARPELVRVACALAVGEAAEVTRGEAAARALGDTLAEGGDDVQRAAAWSLGRIGAGRATVALVRAAVLARGEVRRAALAALLPGEQRARPDPPRGNDGLDVRAWLATLGSLAAPTAPPSLWQAVGGHEDEALAALREALGRHRDLVLRAIGDLSAAEPALAARLLPSLQPLTKHVDVTVRAAAAALFARLPGGAALLKLALGDAAIEVRLSALEALAATERGEQSERKPGPPPKDGGAEGAVRGSAEPVARPASSEEAQALTRAVSHALSASDFRERRAAVLAVGAHPELWPDRAAALRAVRNDPSGFVREVLR